MGTRTENNFLASGAVRCVSALSVPQCNTVEKFPGLIPVGTRAKLVGGSEEVDWRRVKVEEGGRACDLVPREFKEYAGTSGDDRLREVAVSVAREYEHRGSYLERDRW